MGDATNTKQLKKLADIKNIKKEDLISSFYFSAVCNNLPVVLWQNPDNTNLLGITGHLSSVSLNFDKVFSGFAFSPFRNDKGNDTVFLQNNLEINFSEKSVSLNIPDNTLDIFFESFEQILKGKLCSKKWHLPEKPVNAKSYSKEEYLELVKNAISYINSGKAEKIVTSRTQEVRLPDGFNPVNFFSDLCRSYPYTFVSLVSLPGIGTWIGATPEVLVKIKNNQLTTMALAGTQPAKTEPEETIKWSHKEKEEQHYVTEYIEDVLKQSGADNYEKQDARTVRAGNVVHLQTLYTVALDKIKADGFTNDFLSHIHPTPAVCGLPKNEAFSFIIEHETHNREYYSGFLGFVNIAGETGLYVNLRCMQLLENTALLYTGGGIVAESKPEQEWQETELKAGTLLSVMKKK